MSARDFDWLYDSGFARTWRARDEEFIWIDIGLATIIASFCSHDFGANVPVPISHWRGRVSFRTSVATRSYGIDGRLAETLKRPWLLERAGGAAPPWSSRGRELRRSRLAAEYVVALRDERPLGGDSLVVGLVCGIVFAELNGGTTEWDNHRIGYLAPRLPDMTAAELASHM